MSSSGNEFQTVGAAIEKARRSQYRATTLISIQRDTPYTVIVSLGNVFLIFILFLFLSYDGTYGQTDRQTDGNIRSAAVL